MGLTSEFFQPFEFFCKCDKKNCGAVPVKPEVIAKLNAMRAEYGYAMAINSGSRCEYWNSKIGGVPSSQHLKGNAVDIRAVGIGKYRLLELALKHGFTGVGIGQTFIHLDIREIAAVWPAKN